MPSEPVRGGAHPYDESVVAELVPVLRRVVGARIKDPHTLDDLVQETLARLMSSSTHVDPAKLHHYAAVTARHVVASYAERNDRARSRSHLLVEAQEVEPPTDGVLRQEDRAFMAAALAQLPADDRDLLVAHEVDGDDTSTMAAERGSTPGAVAARLARARASLRVEYLLVAEGVDPATDRCRPVLRALSIGDRRRQGELDVHGHLLGCGACAQLADRLFERRGRLPEDSLVRVPVSRDADVVAARQQGREAAAQAGFTASDQTVIATAISEIARNIVKFAERGEVTISLLDEDGRRGIRVVVRDVGPGIADLEEALQDGYSTYQGLGLGLPGAKRLMDRFHLRSVPGEGTTVSMEKWLR
ncbi:sigma-70 family RNA polymerase sigma factor [Nocardioides renjunii]|uniref:sigma-70 family RNA polymerase sigma factor n=1 Tax=Nocardioides renjunii TaxID=3095075 RepID=UPI002AFFD1F9|nr:sigma-70 family RNA polymerase sigma factor [Nocardioides sp. S-34]WQQ20422.1 sigma-70 family RNA polymerase sigma factor [Nocardioides sp. S-34]